MSIEVQYWGWIIAITYSFWVFGACGKDRKDVWVSRGLSILFLVGVTLEVLSLKNENVTSMSSIVWMTILVILFIGGVPGLRYKTDPDSVKKYAVHGTGSFLFGMLWLFFV